MKIIERTIAIAVLAVCVSAAPVASASQGMPITQTVSVRYGDLDLSKTKDQATLRARVRHAAVEVCHYFGPQYDDETFMQQSECMAKALRSANVEVALAINSMKPSAERLALGGKTPR